MRYARLILAGLCSMAILGSALGQTTKPATASDVLKMVPSSAMGVFVVNNVKATTDNVDQFLTAIGVMEQLKAQGMEGGTLAALLKQINMEQGFRAEGGFAATILDPQQFGVDLIQMYKDATTFRPRGADEEPKKEQKIPFALYIPGKSIKDLFTNYEVSTPEGSKYQLVELRMGPVYAMEANGYVVVSPLTKVLDVVAATKKSILDDMNKEQSQTVLGNEMSVFVNMRVTGPVYDKMLKTQQEQMEQMAGFAQGPQAMVVQIASEVTAYYREVVAQVDAVAFGGRFVDEGIVVEEQISFIKDSAMGKATAERKPMAKGRLDLLPARNYIAVVDCAAAQGPETTKARREFIARILANEALDQLEAADKKQIEQLVNGIAEQITGGQLVVGGTPAGEGALAGAAVLQVKDSAAFTKLVQQTTDFTNKIIRQATSQPAGDDAAPAQASKVSLVYKSGATKIADVSVDEISLSVPEEAMDDEDKADMKKAIGDDQVRLLMAATGKDTVIITLGGGTAQMEAAIKTAAKGGGVDLSKATANGMKYMPKERDLLMAFNAANLMKAVKTISGNDDVPALKIDAPILVAGAPSGANYRIVFFVPTAMIKDIVDAVKAAEEGADAPAGSL